jgi:uroporphyrinogen decarboxylase
MGRSSGGCVVTNVFTTALEGGAQARPPIWCMRQAGRYQRAYQTLRRQHSFETLCREPDLSAKVALSSIEDFDFDAAILFSDLLFPLDAIGLGLTYDDSGPRLAHRFTEEFAIGRSVDEIVGDLQFQVEAIGATRATLPGDKGLIGFVGGPWTLFVYAVEGSHRGSLARAKSAMALYHRFAATMVPVLERLAVLQVAAGADLVMVFDTAAGELAPDVFRRHVLPDLTRLSRSVPGRLGYFARGLHPAHLDEGRWLPGGAWAGQGFDWRWSLADLLATPDRKGFVQGNFDPALLHLEGARLDTALDDFLAPIEALDPSRRRGWICGLGHGVLPGTPEASVRTFVNTVRRRLA